jgi:MFS family permease
MLSARAVVGLGEAGYGSAGSAILSHVFPPHRRSAVMGGFLAAALFGSVLGVVLGGVLATHLSWQAAFIVVGVPGLLLALLYPLFVRDYPTVALVVTAGHEGAAARRMRVRDGIKELFGAPAVVFTYVGSGLQMLVQSSIISWLPSYLNRYYGLAPERAAIKAAVVVLIGGVGMVCGGYLADRLSRKNRPHKLRLPALYAFGSFVLLAAAFSLSPGSTQFFLIMMGGFLASAHAGVTVAVVADVIHPGLRTTALATLALAMNLIGLAPGPFIVGALSDAFGLSAAMAIIPLAGVGAATCFQLGSRHLVDGATVRHELA